MPLEHIPGLIGCLNELDVPWDIWVLTFSGIRDDPKETWKKFMSYRQTSVSKIQLASKQPISSESRNALANEQPSDSDNANHDLLQGPGGIGLDRIAKNEAAEVGHQPGGMNVANHDPPPYGNGIEASRSARRQATLRFVGFGIVAFVLGMWMGWLIYKWYFEAYEKKNTNRPS
jgi:hypothetical protein